MVFFLDFVKYSKACACKEVSRILHYTTTAIKLCSQSGVEKFKRNVDKIAGRWFYNKAFIEPNLLKALGTFTFAKIPENYLKFYLNNFSVNVCIKLLDNSLCSFAETLYKLALKLNCW